MTKENLSADAIKELRRKVSLLSLPVTDTQWAPVYARVHNCEFQVDVIPICNLSGTLEWLFPSGPMEYSNDGITDMDGNKVDFE